MQLAEASKCRCIIDADFLRDRLTLAPHEIAEPKVEGIDVPLLRDTLEISGSAHRMRLNDWTRAATGRRFRVRTNLSLKESSLLLRYPIGVRLRRVFVLETADFVLEA